MKIPGNYQVIMFLFFCLENNFYELQRDFLSARQWCHTEISLGYIKFYVLEK